MQIVIINLLLVNSKLYCSEHIEWICICSIKICQYIYLYSLSLVFVWQLCLFLYTINVKKFIHRNWYGYISMHFLNKDPFISWILYIHIKCTFKFIIYYFRIFRCSWWNDQKRPSASIRKNKLFHSDFNGFVVR